jgi:type III secretion protein Q
MARRVNCRRAPTTPMRESTTEITKLETAGPPPPPFKEALPRARLRPLRRVTRAQVAVARRSTAVAAVRKLLTALSATLAEHLAVPIAITARLGDAVRVPAEHATSAGCFYVLELTARGCSALLELDSTAAGLLLERASGREARSFAPPTTLTRIEEAALGWLMLEALETGREHSELQQLLGPRLVTLTTSRPLADSFLEKRVQHQAFEVVLRVGDRSGTARLIVPTEAILAALWGFPEALREPSAELLRRASLEARCYVRGALLHSTDLAQLKPTDVVLFPNLTLDPARIACRARVTTAQFELEGNLAASELTITRCRSYPEELEQSMHGITHPLTVEVEVQLARLRLPLAELCALGEGTVLPLHLSPEPTVELWLGSRPLARAELVDIDGQLGARILTLTGGAP